MTAGILLLTWLQALAIPEESTQLVLVLAPNFEATRASLTRFDRARSGAWRKVGPSDEVVLGRRGLAWGIGLHGKYAPFGEAGPAKEEGDDRSPAGVFGLSEIFGYENAKPRSSRLPYRVMTKDLRCVDDPGSKRYNEIVRDGPTKDWHRAEAMRSLYRLAVRVDHNRAPEALSRDGSCIFLHAWDIQKTPTPGCTALDASRLRALVSWLDAKRRPVLVQLPATAHQSLAPRWRLPLVP